MRKSILDYDTVACDRENNALVIIDQTLLPGKIECISLRTPEQIWDAIWQMKVRGAPALGAAAAIGLAVSAQSIDEDTLSGFMSALAEIKRYLASSRPTAVNLPRALDRTFEAAVSVLCKAAGDPALSWEDAVAGQRAAKDSVFDEKKVIGEVKEALFCKAEKIREEDISVCRRIGENGLALLKRGDGILTHCNAGQLATCKYGTATAPIYLGQERGYQFHVYADETRPMLQGARLTAFELCSAGVDVTLACDSAVSSLMAQGKIQAVLVGCDRVAANGDTANKIGTSTVAVAASYYHVPFYVCAPLSTIDRDTPTGADIVIEQRPGEEVTSLWFDRDMNTSCFDVYNPAFDVTEHSLITAFITEAGVFQTMEKLWSEIDNHVDM